MSYHYYNQRFPPKKSLEDIIEEKIDSYERYMIKEVAKAVSVNKILHEQKFIKDNEELFDTIALYILSLPQNSNIFKGFKQAFINEVCEYMKENAGRLHIKEFMFKKKEMSLDDLFWT